MNARHTSSIPAVLSRRRFISPLAAGMAALFVRPGLMAEILSTPRMTEGPFYPTELPLDRDNNLLLVGDSLTPAVGTVVELSGRVLDHAGEPVRGATVEIWQCDNHGAYLHPGSANHARRDLSFQGYGRFETAQNGGYRFRTIKPVPYPGRTPHIHFAISVHGKRALTTQLFVGGHPMNANDSLYRRVPVELRRLVTGEFVPVPESPVNAEAVVFDLWLGRTPEDTH